MNHQPSSPTDSSSKPVFVRNGFNAIASRYDLLNDLMTFGMHRQWKSSVIQKLSLHDDMRILDLCAGTGDLTFQAVRHNPSISVYALDFSSEMMAKGLERENHLPDKKRTSIHWISGDAMHLPFQDASFDGAMVGFGLRNVADISQTLDEIKRVLKPGSMFVSLDTAIPLPLFRPFYYAYMNFWVPLLGHFLVNSKTMYGYLTSSSYNFLQPGLLAQKLLEHGFQETGYAIRPRWVGGAAIVWGKKPEEQPPFRFHSQDLHVTP